MTVKFKELLKRKDPPTFTHIREAITTIKEARNGKYQQQRNVKADNTSNP